MPWLAREGLCEEELVLTWLAKGSRAPTKSPNGQACSRAYEDLEKDYGRDCHVRVHEEWTFVEPSWKDDAHEEWRYGRPDEGIGHESRKTRLGEALWRWEERSLDQMEPIHWSHVGHASLELRRSVSLIPKGKGKYEAGIVLTALVGFVALFNGLIRFSPSTLRASRKVCIFQLQ